MEPQDILEHTGEKWKDIEQLAVDGQLKSSFYAVVLDDKDDQRLIDPTLPSLKSELQGLWRAKIINPSARNFEGFLLSEKEQETIEEGISLVQVTYLKKDSIYTVQCIRKRSEDDLTRYLMVGIPTEQAVEKKEDETTTIDQSQLDKLQKAYITLDQLLSDGSSKK